MAYLYDYVGQQWKTAARVRQVLDNFYKPEPDGLIGNEDCGQMSAWYVLSAAGFYQVTPGFPTYAIGSPLFPEVRFNLESGKSFVIKARGRGVYIQSATLNHRPYSKAYLSHAEMMAGCGRVFRMGPRPNPRWGTGAGNEAVSQIVGHEIVPSPLINAAGRTFRRSLEIGLNATSREPVKLYYTTNGGDPDENSQQFVKPFVIDAD